jgi:putative FmdB family regulatory protein
VPIYEYRCPNGHTFEVFQRMSDPPSETCVTCGEGPVEKLLFPVAVHFKGSGFYSTDYGRAKKKLKESDSQSSGDKASEKSSDKTSGASSDTSSSDAKPKPKPSADSG